MAHLPQLFLEELALNQDTIVIVGAKRTPMGAFQGVLSDKPSPVLGAAAIGAALAQAGVPPADVSEVVMGCVLPAGLGQAPARQASLGAGVPTDVPATTINKMCGSGMKAAMLAFDQIRAGSADIIVAGGMESMTRAPYLLDRAREGLRLGHGRVLDHMFLDGLEDAYDKGRLMGSFAEDTAQELQFTRQAQDEFALTSLERARRAVADGAFRGEIVAIEGRQSVTDDETPAKARPEKIPTLKPAFREGGTVTAANSSSISDGAAALVLMRMSDAEQRGLTPLAAICGHASHARAPSQFTTAPIGAIRKLYEKIGWSAAEVDLFEINEAFAVVTMAAMRELDLPHDRVNVNGGACALGHPIGASGARILVTLLAALRARGLTRGVASLCIGGGEATAMGVELIH
jgi:acetyl-CoA C-acetyltransferase